MEQLAYEMECLQGENLIFLLSQPRSGSTLLQRVLSGNPEVHTSAETWLLLHPFYGTRSAGISTDYGAKWGAEAVDEFLSNYADGNATYDRGIRDFANRIYGEALTRSGKRVFLDKTPRYFYVIPEIFRIYPKAKYILLYRNPMSVLSSELRTYANEDLNMLSMFADDLLLAPKLLLEAENFLGDNALRVNYEEFVQQSESETRRLCAFLGLEFGEGMINYADTPAPKGKMNDPTGIHQHSQPSASGVDRWHDLAESSQTAMLAQQYLNALGPDIVKSMGYDFDTIKAALGSEVVPDNTNWSWNMAITPRKNWTNKEHIQALRIAAIHDRGQVMGRLRTWRRTLQRLTLGLDFKAR